jgi:hypothetical protein
VQRVYVMNVREGHSAFRFKLWVFCVGGLGSIKNVRKGTKFSSLGKNEYRVVDRMTYTIFHD